MSDHACLCVYVCMCVCTYVCVYVLCACLAPKEGRREHQIPETEVIKGCRPLCGCRELNLAPARAACALTLNLLSSPYTISFIAFQRCLLPFDIQNTIYCFTFFHCFLSNTNGQISGRLHSSPWSSHSWHALASAVCMNHGLLKPPPGRGCTLSL